MRITESALRKIVRSVMIENSMSPAATPSWLDENVVEEVFEEVVVPQVKMDADDGDRYGGARPFEHYKDLFLQALEQNEVLMTNFENETGMDPTGEGAELFEKSLDDYISAPDADYDSAIADIDANARYDARGAESWEKTKRSLMPGRV